MVAFVQSFELLRFRLSMPFMPGVRTCQQRWELVGAACSRCETTICQTGQVDFRVMLTFLEFYRAMVKLPSQVLLPLCAEWAVCASVLLLRFVNFRLYSDLGLAYPPRRLVPVLGLLGFWSDALFCVPRRQLARNRNGTLAEPWNYGPHTLLGCKASFVWQPL